jgi:hypothetical protein
LLDDSIDEMRGPDCDACDGRGGYRRGRKHGSEAVVDSYGGIGRCGGFVMSDDSSIGLRRADWVEDDSICVRPVELSEYEGLYFQEKCVIYPPTSIPILRFRGVMLTLFSVICLKPSSTV